MKKTPQEEKVRRQFVAQRRSDAGWMALMALMALTPPLQPDSVRKAFKEHINESHPAPTPKIAADAAHACCSVVPKW